MAPRPPFSKRIDAQSIEDHLAPRPGIPDGLMFSLLTFLEYHYTQKVPRVVPARRTPKQLRVQHLARLTGKDLPDTYDELMYEFRNNHELLLDAIDHALKYPDSKVQSGHDAASLIGSYLDDARSVYGVFYLDADEYQLVLRQPPEMTTLIEEVLTKRDRASEHLRQAWSQAFSRDGTDPNSASVTATMAIEAAAKDIIIPDDPKATLGKMISAMEHKPEKWTTDFESSDEDSVKTVIGMMKMVWKGHLRHGDPDQPLDVPESRCEMILHTAVLLVHWFQSGRVRPASS